MWVAGDIAFLVGMAVVIVAWIATKSADRPA